MNVLIVDDELSGREVLKLRLLQDFASHIDVCKVFSSPAEVREALTGFKPDLAFVDVEMPDESGFELLESIGAFEFDVVFVTAHSGYALDAFAVNALDYLLKPVEVNALKRAFGKALERYNQKKIYGKEVIQLPDKLGLTTRDGFIIVAVSDIVRCKADDNYTQIILANGKDHIVCKTLKETEKLLAAWPQFLRVHRSHLINALKIVRYSRGNGGQVWMTDDSQIDISEAAREQLKAMLPVL